MSVWRYIAAATVLLGGCTWISNASIRGKLGRADTGDSVNGDTSGDTHGDTWIDTSIDTNGDTDNDTAGDTGTDTGVFSGWEGYTYDIDLAGDDVSWISPTAGPTFVSEIDTTHILLMVEAIGASLDTVAAAGWGGTPAQYPCTSVIDFASVAFVSAPDFTIGPMDALLAAGGGELPLYELTLTGSFDVDGAALEGITLTGLLDLRPLSEVYGMDLCEYLPFYGDSCVDCPDGEPQCVEIEVVDASAPWLPDLTLDADIDPTADPYCN